MEKVRNGLVRFTNVLVFFFFSSRRRHTRFDCDWISDVCSSYLHVLRVCVDSLLTQIEFGLQRIHIIVNSADNETKVLLQNYNNDLITHEFLDNPGPAGGFNIGLQRFLTDELSHVWLMDDDIVVKGDCLKELLRCATNED